VRGRCGYCPRNAKRIKGLLPERCESYIGLTETDKEKQFLIGSSLNRDEQVELILFLRKNSDIFAWKPYDCPGLDAEVVCHKLHINKALTPIKQKPRRMTPEKASAIEEEVQKLLEADTTTGSLTRL
jgi:hypothetical protein